MSCVSPGELGVGYVRGSGWRVVGPTRFELVTSRLSSVRSNQLSYGPIGRIDQDPVDQARLENRNPSLGSRSPHRPERPLRSGKRNEDGGDPLICMIRRFNKAKALEKQSLERR